MKKIMMIMLAAVMAVGFAADGFAQKAKKTETVVFVTSIHCDHCKKNIEDKIPFEKGVKDVKVDVPTKKVTVDYDPAKTDAQILKKAIEKLGYKAEIEKPAAKK